MRHWSDRARNGGVYENCITGKMPDKIATQRQSNNGFANAATYLAQYLED